MRRPTSWSSGWEAVQRAGPHRPDRAFAGGRSLRHGIAAERQATATWCPASLAGPRACRNWSSTSWPFRGMPTTGRQTTLPDASRNSASQVDWCHSVCDQPDDHRAECGDVSRRYSIRVDDSGDRDVQKFFFSARTFLFGSRLCRQPSSWEACSSAIRLARSC